MHVTPQNDPTLADVTVAEMMRHGLVSCRPDDDLATVAEDLVRHGVHAALVSPLEHGGCLILTDLDLVRAAMTRPGRVRAIDITGEPAASLSADSSLAEAVAMMSERYTRHLLVTDPATGVAIGFLSSLDVTGALGGLPHAATPELHAVEPRSVTNAPSLSETTVGSVERLGIFTCAADGSLAEVARTMAERRVHCVAVAGIEHPGEHLVWGLIEDIDLIVAAHGGALSEPAAGFAESSPVAVLSGDSLARAAELMVEHDKSHLVVVDPAGLPAGIVSSLDVAAVLAAGGGVTRA